MVAYRGQPPFAHLRVRTCWSLRDGAVRPRELAAATAAAGMTHVAVTDRDGLYGAVRVARACAREGVVPVFGTDLALEPDLARPGWEVTRAGRVRFDAETAERVRRRHGDRDPRARRPGHGPAWLEDDAPRVTFLARDRAGYGDLCRAVSAAHGVRDGRPDTGWRGPDGPRSATRSSPHLAWGDAALAAARDGCYALLGPDSPVGRLLHAGRVDAAEAELRRWLDVFGHRRVLLGVRRWLEGDPETRRIRHTLELARRLGVRPVAVNDVRHLTERDVFLADVLACVRGQVPLARHHLGRTTAEAWLKPPGEMASLFAERPDLLATAQQVAEACQVELDLGELYAPRLTGLSDETAAGELHHRCWSGLAGRYPRVTPAARERLERELEMVDRLGLHDYLLAVARIVDDVRDAGILAACRGSAAGSLACYALRISDVDPLRHGLAFERFMNPYREELPDIDLDVESARREDVYRMVMDRYGGHRTACVAMVETFQARSAIREVGKVLGLPPDEIDLVAKSFDRSRARDVRRRLATAPELRGARLDAGQLETLFDVVERLDGFPRHLALHPCGILLADTHLLERTPLEWSAPRDPAGAPATGREAGAAAGEEGHGFATSQFDKDDVAALGLLKLDVLGVRVLSSMRHTLDLLPRTRGAEVDLDTLPTDDPGTFGLLRSTRSVGVFQVESPGQRELLGRLQPERFDDLVVEISLFRPGPVKADMVSPFVARRRGGEAATYPHPALEPVLAETHGVVVYHEQVMDVLVALTGCDRAYADLVRRQLGDDRRLPALRAWALSRARDRGFDRATAEAVWQQLAGFASFGFCKAHAAAFAVPTYRSAYLKAHFLPEFLAGVLTHDPGMYPRRLALDEARRFGVAVLPPDVNRSEPAHTVEVVDRALALRALEVDGAHLPPGWRRVADPPPTRPPRSVPGAPPAPATARGEPDGAHLLPPGGWDAGDAGDGRRYALRVGLQDVRGITAAELDSLRDGRPFTSLLDVRRRARLSRPTAEHLCHAGAFDRLAGSGAAPAPDRRRVRLAVEELWAARGRATGDGTAPAQTHLDLHADHEPRLPAETAAELVRHELTALGLDVTRHVLSFYEPLLAHLGVVRASDLVHRPDRERVRVAGVKVAVQSPAVRSGQRVLFLSLDDRTATAQVTYFAPSLDACAWTVLHAWLLLAEGRVRRRGARGVTVDGGRAWDLSRLWRAWTGGWLAAALAERGTPAAHEREDPPAARRTGLTAAEFGRGAPR